MYRRTSLKEVLLETGNPEVLGDVKVVQKDFLEGGLGFRRRIIAIAAKFFQQLLHRDLGVIGPGQPEKDKIKVLLHFHRSLKLVEGGGI